MSRRNILDEDLINQITAAVSVGATPQQALRALGISRSTYHEWVKRGRDPGPGDGIYVRLFDEIDQARGSAIVQLIIAMRKIAGRDWRAAAKLLEMNDRDWARAAGQQTVAAPGDPPTIRIVIETEEPSTTEPEFIDTTGRPVEPPSIESADSGDGGDLEAAARLLGGPEESQGKP